MAILCVIESDDLGLRQGKLVSAVLFFDIKIDLYGICSPVLSAF